jgi:coenzyme F420-reducing hydrogenase delta subunit
MLACPPGECHYGHGNLLARQRMAALLDELAEHGIDTRRIRLELIKGDDVVKFTRTVTEFVTALQARAPKQIYQPVL